MGGVCVYYIGMCVCVCVLSEDSWVILSASASVSGGCGAVGG